MSKHLNPKSSELLERHKFNNTYQLASETINDFVARLKRASMHCNFPDVEVSLRDQFVCGINNHKTRVELFRKGKISFSEALKIAETRELAMESASNTTGTSNSSNNVYSHVNYVIRMQTATKLHY